VRFKRNKGYYLLGRLRIPVLTDNVPGCKVDMAKDAIHLSNGLVTVSYNTLLGTITLVSEKDKRIIFSRGYVLVHTEKQVLDSRKMVYRAFSGIDFQENSVNGKAIILRVQDVDNQYEMNIKIAILEGLMGFTILIQFKNKSDELQISSIDNLVIDVNDASSVSTGWDGQHLRFFKNGFHSWSLSQAIPIEEGENTSHFFSVLNNLESGHAYVLGFITLADQFTEISAFGRENEDNKLAQIVATCRTDNIPITEKDMLVSEELMFIASDDPLSSLGLFFDFVKDEWCIS